MPQTKKLQRILDLRSVQSYYYHYWFMKALQLSKSILTCFQHMALVNECPIYIPGVLSSICFKHSVASMKFLVTQKLCAFVKKADVIIRSDVWSRQLQIVLLAAAHALSNVCH